MTQPVWSHRGVTALSETRHPDAAHPETAHPVAPHHDAPASQVADLPGRTMAYRHRPATSADAAPAVLIHGLGGSALNWTDLTWGLRDRLETWAVDLSGFGMSPPPRDGDVSPAGYARGVAEFIEFLGRGPVHIFGNSLGGAVAVQLAARRPDLVLSVTLVSPALPRLLPQRAAAHMPIIALPGIGERLVGKYLTLDAAARVDATMDACFEDPGRLSEHRRAESVAEVRERDAFPYTAEVYLGALRGLLRTYLDTSWQRPWKLAERILCPVVVIYGRTDKLVDSVAAHKVTRHFKDAHVVVIPDSGHVAQMEHPELVDRAWRRFLG